MEELFSGIAWRADCQGEVFQGPSRGGSVAMVGFVAVLLSLMACSNNAIESLWEDFLKVA